MLFTPDWLRKIGTEIGVTRPDHLELRGSIEPEDEFLTGLLRTFQKEVLKPEVGSRLLIDSLSQALAVHLIRRYTDRQLINGQPSIIPKWRIRRAQDFIRENLAYGISLKEIADASGDVSPYHFSRSFKQATGFSPHQFLIECRVLTAQQLLRGKRELSLGEIAFRCGFADQSAFTRCFRQRTGLTPKQYRERLAEDLGFIGMDSGGLEHAALVEGVADFLRLQIVAMGLGTLTTLSIKILNPG